MEATQLSNYTAEDYYATPEDVRVELIDGQFYNLASPSLLHQTLISEIHTIINNYIHTKRGDCRVLPAPFAVKLEEDKDNIVEPDISVICDPQKLNDKGCTGAPDWIIEIISPSTASNDFIRKLNLYQAAGVKEYWIVDPQNQLIFVHILENGKYESKTYDFSAVIKVGIYDDLNIDFSKLPIA